MCTCTSNSATDRLAHLARLDACRVEFGYPIGWDDLLPIDGYRIAGYRDEGDTSAGETNTHNYNYDGSAVRGETKVLYNTFRYVDQPTPNDGPSAAPTERTVGIAIVDVSYNVADRCGGGPSVLCETNSDPGANPGTQFAYPGRLLSSQGGASFGQIPMQPSAFGDTVGLPSVGQMSISSSTAGRLISTNAPVFPPATAAPMYDRSAFIADITVPDGSMLAPSQSFTKTWRLRNSGTSTWGSGYQLAFISGERMQAPASVAVPSTAPGQTADVNVPMVAPSGEGEHQGYWRLKNLRESSSGTSSGLSSV